MVQILPTMSLSSHRVTMRHVVQYHLPHLNGIVYKFAARDPATWRSWRWRVVGEDKISFLMRRNGDQLEKQSNAVAGFGFKQIITTLSVFDEKSGDFCFTHLLSRKASLVILLFFLFSLRSCFSPFLSFAWGADSDPASYHNNSPP